MIYLLKINVKYLFIYYLFIKKNLTKQLKQFLGGCINKNNNIYIMCVCNMYVWCINTLLQSVTY